MADQLLSVEGFADEKRSVEDIRRRIQLSRLFKIYDEVRGKTLDEAMHQAITYMDSVWTLGDWRGLVVLSSVFVWPYYWPAKSAGYAARMQYSRVGVIEPMMRDGYRMIRKDGQPMLSWTPQAGLRTVLE
jgi:hypothetical protein